ncbi:MAG TPA: hypothetical protein PK189_05155 [bacterium]|nr:hypothetical protein [bacterium]
MLLKFENDKIKIYSDNQNIFNGIIEFAKLISNFSLPKLSVFLFNNNNKNFFKINKLDNQRKKTYLSKTEILYHITKTKFVFNFYNKNFIVYLDVKKNIIFGIIKKPQKYAAHFFDNFILQPIFYLWLIKQKKYFFHSALISFEDKGILIIGNSGSGKSTLTFLLLNLLNEKAKYFTDDKTILYKKKNEIVGKGIPTLLKIKNPEIEGINEYIKNFKIAFKIKDMNYLMIKTEEEEVKIKYLFLPKITNKKTRIKKLKQLDLYYKILSLTHPIIWLFGEKKYENFVKLFLENVTAYKIYLGKQMLNTLKKFIKHLK